MPRLFFVFLIALSVAAQAGAAALDPSRIAAIDQATREFLTRAAEARKTGMVPRQSDPAIGRLLDTVFDTSDLQHGTIDYDDHGKLTHWQGQINTVGDVYLSAAKKTRDVGLFGVEIGRYYDASAVALRATVDCFMAYSDAHSSELSAEDRRQLTGLRSSVAAAFGTMIKTVRVRNVTIGWVKDRLTALTAAAPSLARFLTVAQLADLRAIALQVAGATRDKPTRAMVGGLAAALAAPPPPLPKAAEVAVAGAEIALEGDGRSYWVPVRINGARTVKFIVDSGASVVVLPKDLVDSLIKTGTIAESDLLGPNVYVTADGKRHRGKSLMLRQLDVGGHIVTNIMANVAPEHAIPLLGQSFLAKFKSWTLDNRRRVLVISE